MTFDLDSLRARHPRIHAEHAADLALHGAVALQRSGHAPGARMVAHVGEEANETTLRWMVRANDAHEMLDAKRITEFGAEVIALSLVHEVRGWVALRRLQEGDSADWLLEDADGVLIAFEISGTIDGDAGARMRQKLDQVADCEDGETLSACVVRFEEPATWLADVTEDPR